MSDTVFLKVMDNGGYFALIIWIWFILYKLWKIFINWYLELEKEKNKTQLELDKQKSEGLVTALANISTQNINNTKQIVSWLNTHIINDKDEHKNIIWIITDTNNKVLVIHKDVQDLKWNIWKK